MTLDELQSGLKNSEQDLELARIALANFLDEWRVGDVIKLWDEATSIWFTFPYDQLREQLQNKVNVAKAEFDRLSALKAEIDKLLLASVKDGK